MTPGQYLYKTEQGRRDGASLRDTILILLPGPKVLPVYLLRANLEGSVAANILRHGTGAINVDGCRVALNSNANTNAVQRQHAAQAGDFGAGGLIGREIPTYNPAGRWPTNVVLVHGPGCRFLGTTKAPATSIHGEGVATRRTGVHASAGGHQTIGHVNTVRGYADDDGTETVNVYECQPDCPIRLLDEQSGERPSGAGNKNTSNRDNGTTLGNGLGLGSGNGTGGDSGSASRFFPQFGDLDEAMAWLAKLTGATPGDHVAHQATGPS